MAKICIECAACQKAPRLQRCWECHLARSPVDVREVWAKWRLEAVPEPLRLARVPREAWPQGRRWCSGCQTFVRLKDCGRTASRCKTCVSVQAHGSMVQRVYGISREEYAALFKAQHGRCYICRERPRSKRLAVDHDHKTGKVRGLLCADNEWGCNYAIIGKMKDAEMAWRAWQYLVNPPADKVIDQR